MKLNSKIEPHTDAIIMTLFNSNINSSILHVKVGVKNKLTVIKDQSPDFKLVSITQFYGI